MISKIFLELPYVIKCLVVTCYNGLKNKKRKGHHYSRISSSLQTLKPEEIEGYQEQSLVEFLNEVKTYTDYYKNHEGNTLSSFPIVNKSFFRKNIDLFINKNPSRKAVEENHTSGTSGSPMVTYYDEESIAKSFAIWSKYKASIGVKEGQKSVRFSGKIVAKPSREKPPFWIYDFSEKILFMSTYHLTDSNLKHYIKKLNDYKPKFLDGYPSSFYVLAKFILKNSIILEFEPVAISTTAETLYGEHRKIIEEAFKCKVFNQYASSEGIPFIAECKNQKLHLYDESGVFEFFTSDGKVAQPGDYAELIATSLRSYKTVLVRYATGDFVRLAENTVKCDCGNPGQIIQEIVGRQDDLLYTAEKGWVGRMDTAYKGVIGIEKSQLVQNSIDSLEVNQVVNPEYSLSQENLFKKNLVDRLGNKIEIRINYVEEIPLGPNGKFDAVKRNFEI